MNTPYAFLLQISCEESVNYNLMECITMSQEYTKSLIDVSTTILL